MTDYKPQITISKDTTTNPAKFIVHIHIPLPNASETIMLKGSPTSNHETKIKTYEYDVLNAAPQVMDNFHEIPERPAADNHDEQDCDSIQVIVNHPPFSPTSNKKTTKQYSDVKKK